MRRAAFVFDDTLSNHVLRENHPMQPIRLKYTYDLLNAYGAFNGENSRLVKPREASEFEVAPGLPDQRFPVDEGC